MNSVCVFLVSFVIFYFWHIIGVTVGYHRFLSHRSFRCHKLVEYFFVLSGYLAFQASPIFWATIHRAHHRYTDSPLDPHSPRNGGLNAYFGWIFQKQYPAHIDPKVLSPDLYKDPVYRFLERGGNWHKAHLTNTFFGFGSRLLLGFIVGWPIALASLLAGLLVQQVPFFLNVACHLPKNGYQNYPTGDDSVNVWWVSLFTAGEGWHNNHHAFPGSARTGFKRYEIDPGWYLIRALKSVGLVTWANDAGPSLKFQPEAERVPAKV